MSKQILTAALNQTYAGDTAGASPDAVAQANTTKTAQMQALSTAIDSYVNSKILELVQLLLAPGAFTCATGPVAPGAISAAPARFGGAPVPTTPSPSFPNDTKEQIKREIIAELRRDGLIR